MNICYLMSTFSEDNQEVSLLHLCKEHLQE